MLRRIRRVYPRVLTATTTGGYEGPGSGFRQRFVAELERDGLASFALRRPVRWCDGDRLEAWLNRCLVLDPEPTDAASTPAGGEPSFAIRGSADLPLAHDAHALLADAHYRTRPSDLPRLLGEPGQWLVVARRGGNLVGVAWLQEEGGFDADLCEQVFLGRRRPPGHLLAQMLTAQAGCRGRGSSLGTAKAGKAGRRSAGEIHLEAGGIGETTVADVVGQYPLSARDALQRRDHRAAIRHVIFDPLDFVGKLAALVPKPRVNLTRFHGVFAGRRTVQTANIALM